MANFTGQSRDKNIAGVLSQNTAVGVRVSGESQSRTVADPRPEARVTIVASKNNLKRIDANNITLKLLDDADLVIRKIAVQAVSRVHDASVHAKLKDLEIRDPALPIRDAAKSKIQELKLIGAIDSSVRR
jgi:hypothetical protein